MTEYFTSVVMNQTIDMVTKGLRDFRSPTLRPFYEQPDPIPDGYAQDQFESVREIMLENKLPCVTQPGFSSQLSNAEGTQLFTDFMADGGMVQTETGNDFIEQARPESLSGIQSVDMFLDRLVESGDIELNLTRIRETAALVKLPQAPDTAKHLSLPLPGPVGELDPIVARRFAKMRQYVRSYFSE